MDAKAITEKSKALMKATSSNEKPSVILALLNDLKVGVAPNEDILRSTRIGVTVNKVKQHKDPAVAQLAGQIVRKWRDEVQNKRDTPGKKSSISSGNASPAPSSTPKSSSTTTTTLSVPPDQRNWKKDKVDTARTGQAVRDNCIGLIYDGLAYMTTTPPSTVLTVAVAVESAAFSKLGPEDRSQYKTKVRSLYQNLKNKSNSSLRHRVTNGEIKPEQFVSMSADDLKSAERREEDAKLENENMRLAQAPQAEKSVSNSLECSKCKNKKVSYSQAQTRSADEPMTTFCECLVCGKRWKFS